MSVPKRGVRYRAQRGERGSLLLTTTAGQQIALAGLDAEQVGRLLKLTLTVMVETHCESETIHRPGHYLAPPEHPRRPRG